MTAPLSEPRSDRSPPRAAPPPHGGDKGILRLSLPIVVSFGLRSTYTLVDTAYAASLEGVEDASVAAIGFTTPIELLMTACWVGASNGLTARLAAALGARQGGRIDALVRAARGVVVALVAAFLALAVVIWLTAEHLGLDAATGRQLKIYATVLVGGSALSAFWSILPDSLVKAHQDTRSTMWAGIISGGVNVALNTLFVFAFAWGILGIALSTVIARLFALVYAQRRAARHERERRASGLFDEPCPAGRPTREILAIAVPSSLSFFLVSLESLAVNWIVKGAPDSTAALAAWGIFDRMVRLFAMPLIAVGVAMLPLVARLHGRGDLRAIREQVRVATLFGAAYLLLVVLPFALFFGDATAGWLTQAAEARERAAVGLAWMPLAVLAMGPFFPIRAAFEGLGEPRPGLVVGTARVLLLVVPLTAVCVRAAPSLGFSSVAGAFAGSTVGTLAGTAWLWLWMRARLRADAGARRL